MQQLDNGITQYSVRFWEIILIVIGAIALISLGLIGLGIKALNNAFDPARAEAIAKSFMDYKIPGAQGIVGFHIGAIKLAAVQSSTNPPDVILSISETPVKKEIGREDADLDVPFQIDFGGTFTAKTSRIDLRSLCGQTVPVTIATGEKTFTDQPGALPAVRYSAQATEADIEREVTLITTGNKAEEKAANVFSSLQCR